MSANLPVSPYETCHGLVYFSRMIDKIRLHAAGKLGADYVPNLGKGFDLRCCSLLGVEYASLAAAVGATLSDEEAWSWVAKNGQAPSEEQIEVWNGFMTRRGWKDDLAEILERRKKESGFAKRPEIQTMFDYIDADEGRAIRRG
jgi:gluconokinase